MPPRNPKPTAKRLLACQRKLQYLERQERRLKMNERKLDTREKIQLGGLIKKAGLADVPLALLLGLLCEARERLESLEEGEHLKTYWKLLGDRAFSNSSS